MDCNPDEGSVVSGHLTLFIGPMFSSKTTTLLKEISRHADLCRLSGFRKPLVVNSATDVRDEVNVVSSHSSSYKGVPDVIDVRRANKLGEVCVDEHHVIGVDEANFFSDLVPTVTAWLKRGKQVYCAGLSGSYDQKHFGDLHLLYPLADRIEFLAATCHGCMAELRSRNGTLTPVVSESMRAPFTKKIGGDRDKIVDVGGKDKYEAACRLHLAR